VAPSAAAVYKRAVAEDLDHRSAALKAELDALRPLGEAALAQLQKHYDVELTFTSNAIEGNTLTLRETAEVIEHGVTVGGKPLRDHLEALDHYDAVQWMRGLASGTGPVDETVICELHRRIVARSRPDIAGVYATLPRRVAGSPAIFPHPAKIPDLMAELGAWLSSPLPSAAVAFDAHFRLTAIHPFADGNGRTARLLMNLILLRAGYPPVPIRPEDRADYLTSLETGSVEGDLEPFRVLMNHRLADTLAAYVVVLNESAG
jgi:Fic family protein